MSTGAPLILASPGTIRKDVSLLNNKTFCLLLFFLKKRLLKNLSCLRNGKVVLELSKKHSFFLHNLFLRAFLLFSSCEQMQILSSH